MCSFCKRSINLEETISTPNNYYLSTCTRLPTTIVTQVLHNNSCMVVQKMDYYAIHQIEWISIYQEN